MSRKKHYPLLPGKEHAPVETVNIPRLEYESLREIVHLHEQLLKLVRERLPDVHEKFVATKK